ncbi:MAG: HEAT repeat domain-containing protein [Verrucomicrobiia bacterium]
MVFLECGFHDYVDALPIEEKLSDFYRGLISAIQEMRREEDVEHDGTRLRIVPADVVQAVQTRNEEALLRYLDVHTELEWDRSPFGELQDFTPFDKGAMIRAVAARELGRLRSHRGVDQLNAILFNDPNAEVKRSAAIALGEINYYPAASALIAALRNCSEDVGVRIMAALALGQYCDEESEAALKACLPATGVKENGARAKLRAAIVAALKSRGVASAGILKI